MPESSFLIDSDLKSAFPASPQEIPDAAVKLGLLRELHQHYLSFFTPPEETLGMGEWEASPRIAQIESAWNEYEEKRVREVHTTLPGNAAEFRDWYFSMVPQHEYDDLCKYLRDDASLLDIALFMLAEEKVDGRFDDIIALSQIGATGVTKMTIAHNFWDEMGNGDYNTVHTSMFDHSANWMRTEVVAGQGIDADTRLEIPEVYANACELLMYGLKRRWALRSLASIGLLETTSSARFGATVAGSRRLGVPDHVLRYQEVHVHVDEDHGREWFDGVFMPIIEARPESAAEFAIGVAIRGNVASEFYRKVQDTLFGLG